MKPKLLFATILIMLADFIATLIGMALDPRTITGVNAWLKPAKFGISGAIYAATIVWLFGYITVSPVFKRWCGILIALALNIEILVIDIQAARGTTSHFNFTTPLNGILFGVMGAWIGVLLVASAGVAVLLMRQKFADATWGWALRLGMVITVLGSAAGGLMTHTMPGQEGGIRGAHTVGAPDGGAGLPGVGWSAEHGDLRIPHFFGLHAVQVIPFFAFLVARRRRAQALVFAAAGSYLAFIAILTWQALRGESIIRPGPETLTALGVWLAATVATGIATQVSAPAQQPIGASL